MNSTARLPIVLVSIIVALLCAAPLAAQTLTNAFGGLTESSNEPIDIESDVLVVHDKEKYATFKGNVKAVQGTTVLRARELNVHYVGGDKLNPGPKKEGGGEVAAAVDLHLNVADRSTARVQEVHITVLHAICAVIERGM